MSLIRDIIVIAVNLNRIVDEVTGFILIVLNLNSAVSVVRDLISIAEK